MSGLFSGTDVSLWTIQSVKIVELLGEHSIVKPDWQPSSIVTIQGYQWLRSRIVHPEFSDCKMPFWCWYFNKKDCYSKVIDAGRSLLSDNEMRSEFVLLELSVPTRIVEFTYYDRWNDLLDRISIFGESNCAITPTTVVVEFSQALRSKSQIQAIIPYIDTRWIETSKVFQFS